jgi:hypothetical protein
MLSNNEDIECLTYVKFNDDEPLGLPSRAYKNVLINGAQSIGMPDDYLNFLRSFEDNCRIDINIKIPRELYEKS